MDAGKVFIREPGKSLRVLLSPVRRKIRKQQREKSKNVFSSTAIDTYWCKVLQNVAEKSQNQPKSLFYSSMDFIIENIDCVESLTGIPEIIGEQIFNRLQRYSVTNRFIPTNRTIQLFVDAYGDKLVKSLCLRDSLFTINEYLDLFTIFLPYVRELDLSECRLGDNHELIENLGQLQCLQSLNLNNNALTDKTLRRMTVSYPRSPIELRNLSLAYNSKITQRGLNKLICFKELAVLDITGINVDNVGELAVSLNMEICDSDSVIKCQIETKGWCEFLLRGINQAVVSAIGEEVKSKNSDQARFYGRRRKICLNLFKDEFCSTTTILKKKRCEKYLDVPATKSKSKPTTKSNPEKFLIDDVISQYM